MIISSLSQGSSYGFEVVPTGWYGDLHPAPGRVLAIYPIGREEIEASDGEIRILTAGTIFLAEDTTGKGHFSRVTGTSKVLVAIAQLPG